MHRAALFLCALVAAAAGGLLAAPAPFPRVGRGPWYDGWDRPVDPVGDCKFDRVGERLTITVPGKGHELDIVTGRLNAARLLRDVEGDFEVRVRVGGNYQPAELMKPGLLQQAGIFVHYAEAPLKYAQSAKAGELEYRLCGEFRTSLFAGGVFDYQAGPSLKKPVHLCVKRRGNIVWMTGTTDYGKKWAANQGIGYELFLPKKVKLGVFAEATAPGTFRAVFDQWKLTRLGGNAIR